MLILTVILSSIIVFFSFMVFGLIGFGSSLIMVPLMLLFFEIKLVVPVVLMLNLISSTVMAITSRPFVKKSYLYPLIIGGLAGAIIGSYFLATSENIILKKIYGIIIILFALNTLFPRMKLKSSNKLYGVLAGLISGALGAIYQTGGPPASIYLTHQVDKKQVFRATLIAFWVFLDTWLLFLFLYLGLINSTVINFSVSLLPATLIGIIVGSKLHIKINENLFQKIIGIVLVFTGALLLF